MINWLNYHHLYYFWIIAQEKSVSAAAARLRLAQPTLSAQLKQLEENLRVTLFHRKRRSFVLTEDGELVFKYAESIFELGAELRAVLQGGTPGLSMKLRVGVTDSVPRMIAHMELTPVWEAMPEVKIECFEGKREALLSQLGSHDLDLVLSDAPFASEVAVKAFNHLLGSSSISLYGTEKLVRSLKGRGLKRFTDAPFILPTKNTMLRRAVDQWLEENEIAPRIIAEFEDSALLKNFGADGWGFFPVVAVVEKEIQKHYQVVRAAKLDGVKEDFYAISLERKVTHPAIAILTESAKRTFA